MDLVNLSLGVILIATVALVPIGCYMTRNSSSRGPDVVID